MRYLALCVALALPGVAQAAPADPQPTAWTERVQPLDAVERITMPPVDAEAMSAEDERHFADTGEKDLRYAANLKADLTPETAGTWERLDSGELLWRLRVFSKPPAPSAVGSKSWPGAASSPVAAAATTARPPVSPASR